MITKRDVILRGSYFYEKYSKDRKQTLYLAMVRSQLEHFI